MAEGGDVVEVGDALDVSLASAATPSLRPAEKIARYNDIVADSIFSTTPPNTLKAKRFVNHVISDGHVPLLVSKQVMINFLAKLCDTQDAFDEDLSLHVLAQMEARVESYGKEIFLLRDYIAGHYEHGSDFSKAVDILTGADFESRIGILDNYNKFCKCLRIADLCLEIGDVSKAEPYIKNASTFLQSVDDPALILNYKCCNAVYLDLKIRLLEAATEYHEVSKTTQMQIGRIEINKEEMKEHLNSAVTCALLSAACPERSRVLSLLSQDKRCPSLKLYPVLQKVILGEFLNKEDASTLEKELSPHHKTPLSEGPTLLEKMMTEHNILCIYNANSSSLSLFSNMLAMDPHKVTNSSAIMSAAKVKTALSSVKHEIGNAHHTLQLEHNAYDAYKLPQPKRRLHLDIAQAHERAERGYSELSGTIENIVNEIKSELDAALNSLGSELEGIDLACSSAEF